jgi:cysteine desulfurase
MRTLLNPDPGACQRLIERHTTRWNLPFGVLTTGATQANHRALEQLPDNCFLLASPTLHPSLLTALRRRPHNWLAMAPDGSINPGTAEQQIAALEGPAALVLDAVDSVTGACHPWRRLVRAAGTAGQAVHLDASQLLTAEPLDVQGEVTLTLSGHKAGAVAGIGALLSTSQITAPDCCFESAWCVAWEELLEPSLEAEMACHLLAADKALASLVERVAGLRSVTPSQRRPGIVSAVAEGLSGALLVEALDVRGVAASAGSACAAGRTDPPFGLQRAGWSQGDLRGLIRFSAGWRTNPAALALLLPVVQEAVADVAEVMR